MKRFFLPVCLLALFCLSANTGAVAQSETPENGIIVIQKLTSEDGTISVRKKRFDKGQSPDEYLKGMEAGPGNQKMELTLLTEDITEGQGDTETILFFRDNGSGEEIIVKGPVDWSTQHDADKQPTGCFVSPDYIVKQQITGISENKALLGIFPESAENGVLVSSLVEGGGAEKAGLQAGDVITALNGIPVKNNGDLHTELSKYKPGDVVVADYLRNGVTTAKGIALTERQDEVNYNYNYNYNYDYNYDYGQGHNPCKVFIGVSLGSAGEGEAGVGVSGIIPGWPAEEMALQAGDRILALDGIRVNSYDELTAERNKHKPGESFQITYLRDGSEYEVDGQFKECPEMEAPKPESQPEPQPAPAPAVEFTDNLLELGDFAAYPNPTAGNLNIRFQGEALPTVLTVTDINGKLVYQEKMEQFDGFYSKLIDVSSGAPGTLTLTVNQDGKLQSKPVVLVSRA